MDIVPIVIVGVVFAFIAVAVRVLGRRPRRLNQNLYQAKWRDVQKLCASRDCWRQAVLDADDMLADVLKKKRFGGKTTGERLTKAQRLLSDNEKAWFGHKLRTKLDVEPKAKLKQAEVKQALMGIRQALKDLGAFPNVA